MPFNVRTTHTTIIEVIGPIHGAGHSGPLCHALSSSLSLTSWTSMRRRRATVQWRHLKGVATLPCEILRSENSDNLKHVLWSHKVV